MCFWDQTRSIEVRTKSKSVEIVICRFSGGGQIVRGFGVDGKVMTSVSVEDLRTDLVGTRETGLSMLTSFAQPTK